LLGLPSEVVSPAPDPAEAAELADITARVRGAVAALPYGQRNAVLLFYLQGLSHREVAAELGISVGAVKARLHQARASLAPKLASVAAFEEETTMTTEAAEWIEVSVSGIRRSHGDEEEWQRKFVMVLAERDGERTLPIWIGPAEAISLAMELQSAETPRPFTYKLAADLVGAAGAKVAEVRITRLIEEVFYASVLIDGPAGRHEVDSRPSDAVILALVAGAPVKVEAGLLRAGQAAGPAGELGSLPVATAEIAVEAQQRIRERRWHLCGPGADPAT
jgi:bifunctional DNase/RNase